MPVTLNDYQSTCNIFGPLGVDGRRILKNLYHILQKRFDCQGSFVFSSDTSKAETLDDASNADDSTGIWPPFLLLLLTET